MVEPLKKRFHAFYKESRSLRLLQAAAFFFVLAPVLLAGVFSFFLIDKQFDDLILARRPTIAFLAASHVESRLDGLVDLGRSLSSRVAFRGLVEEGKWQEAAEILRQIPVDYSYIDRVALFDVSGTAMAGAPRREDSIGRNFAFRDWYKGVTRNWEPYVSEVYRRSDEPTLNVLGVATPILDEAGGQIGILLMQVRLEAFIDWASRINVGTDGYVYIVDQRGHIVAHPRFDLRDEIVDFSGMESVKNAISGRSGILTSFNQIENEERIAAFAPVSGYGWGVVVSQSTAVAFAEKYQELRLVLYAYILAAILAMLFAFAISRFFRLYQEFREREKAFLESIGEGVMASDEHGVTLFMNTAAEQMLGWTKDEVVGKSWTRDTPRAVDYDGKPVPYEDRATTITLLSRKPVTKEYDYVRRDGSRMQVSVTASPIMIDGRLVGSIAVFRDVGEVRKLDKAKTEFVSLASHQLRTPMTSMKWYVDLILSGDVGELTDKQKETLRDLATINKNMIDLVSGLLNVARIELNTYAIEPQPVSITEISDSVLSELLPMISDKKLNIKKDYDSGLPLLTADPSLLRVLLQNLYSNAVKYTPAEGRVSITIAWRVDMVEIIVTDTGYGIPKDQQKMIFSKMFRADNIRSKVMEGTGLGLYASKAIVDAAGGRIWFESEEGQGTTFHVTLPKSGMRRKQGTTRLN